MLVGYRTGDMWAPQLAIREALSVEAAHFVECITSGHEADDRRRGGPARRAPARGGERSR